MPCQCLQPVGLVKGERGQHFDPDIADIFINNYEDFVGELKKE